MTDEVVVVKCCIRGLVRNTKRSVKGEAHAPKGWKNHAGQLYCTDDCAKKYVAVAITVGSRLEAIIANFGRFGTRKPSISARNPCLEVIIPTLVASGYP